MADHKLTEDEKVLHGMGYAQELARRMSGFSNFAISFSIICILAGGITVLSAMGLNLVEWEPEFLESIGNWFIWIAIILAAVIAAVVLIVRKPASNK